MHREQSFKSFTNGGLVIIYQKFCVFTKSKTERKVMKKIVFSIIIILTMNSCGLISRIGYRSINTIKEETVSYSSLPVEVKEYFHSIKNIKTREEKEEFFNNSENVPLSEKHTGFFPNLYIFNTPYEYEFTDADRITGQIPAKMWISHFLLIDKTNKISYRINYEICTRLIFVCDREIFTPTKLNAWNEMVLKNEDEIKASNLTFNRYLLSKDGRYRRVWRRDEKKRVKQMKINEAN